MKTKIIFDWTFINPLNERDDGKKIKQLDEASKKLQKQSLETSYPQSEVYL